jgi:uncharacterized membrane protein YhfC
MDWLVVTTFAFVIILEIAIPLGLGYWFKRKLGVSWVIFGLGAGFFVAVQIFHTPLVLLTEGPLYQFLLQTLGNVNAAIIGLALYLGLLAGLFEEIGRYLVYQYWFARRSIALSRENGLMFGTGWGGIESIFVAFLLLITMINYIVVSSTPGILSLIANDTAAQQQVLALLQLTPLDILPGLFERIMTITLQIAFSLMVLASVVYRQYSLLAVAVVWHAAVDFFAVYLGQTVGILPAELSLFAFWIAGVAYILWEWRRMGARQPAT